MSTIGPIKRVNLSEEISNCILEQVKSGHFKSGERLASERELCEMFDASRTSVREAIKGLTSLGVIQRRRDGNYICENLSDIMTRPFNILLSTKELNLFEVAEARLAVESQLARLSAVRATDEDLQQMEACLKEEDLADSALMHKSIRFHQLIAASTQNRVLQEMYNVIYRILLEKQQSEDSLRKVHRSQTQHRDIFDAIKAHDPDRAEEAMKDHLAALVEHK